MSFRACCCQLAEVKKVPDDCPLAHVEVNQELSLCELSVDGILVSQNQSGQELNHLW